MILNHWYKLLPFPQNLNKHSSLSGLTKKEQMIDLYYMINPYNKIYLSLIDPSIYHKFYLAKGIIRNEKFAVAV